MNNPPPEFFQPSSASAWIGFGLFFAALAYFFPWLLGILIGMVAFYFVLWLVFGIWDNG